MKRDKNTQKIAILQVVPSLISGGVEIETIDVAKYLDNAGYLSIILSSGGGLLDELQDSGVLHIELDVATKNPIKIIRNAFKISKILKKYSVRIIHPRSRAPAWSCLIASMITGVPMITTFHGTYNIGNFLKKFYNSVMVRGQKVVAISDFIQKHIIANYDVHRSKVVVVNRWVDEKKFCIDNVSDEEIENFEDKYSVRYDHNGFKMPVVLMPARLTELKGHFTLIRALHGIRENFYCIMVGDISKNPKYFNMLIDAIHGYELDDKVKIFDNESNMVPLYAIANVVVSVSEKPEAFGRTIIEAQSMEKMVIGSKIGATIDNIKDGETGFHFKARDYEHLRDVIEYCFSILGTKYEKVVVKNARQSVIHNFSSEKMLALKEQVYIENF